MAADAANTGLCNPTWSIDCTLIDATPWHKDDASLLPKDAAALVGL